MKILKKLSINPEKVIKNEELVNLRGGGYANCICYILWPDGAETTLEGACGTSTDCNQCAIDLMNEPHYAGCNIACE